MGWGEPHRPSSESSTGTTRDIELAHAALDKAGVPAGSLGWRAQVAAQRLVDTDDTPRGEVFLAITGARLHADLKRRNVGSHFYRMWLDNPHEGVARLAAAAGGVAICVVRNDVQGQIERLNAVAEIAVAWLEAWARQSAGVRGEVRRVRS